MTKKEREEKEIQNLQRIKSFDEEYLKKFKNFVGIDEAGRGPLAGPVVVCGIIMKKESNILGVKDSKKLSKKRREELIDEIIKDAVEYRVAIISNEIIDEINILEATKYGAEKLLSEFSNEYDAVVTDALKIHTNKPIFSVIKGDDKSYSIACASIIAKVTRDRLMIQNSTKYPEYGFEKHMGYGTKMHIEAIKKIGLCPIHRKSFVKHFI